MAAFHLGMELSLADRQRFLLVLCERLGVNGTAAWKSFLGNASSTGLL